MEDPIACDYDEFVRTTGHSLAVGSLERHAGRPVDEWPEHNMLQMTGRRPALDSRGGMFVVVTDGMAVAEVRVPNIQTASCIAGSVVTLRGVRHVAGAFEAADLTVQVDAGQEDVPFIDTDNMKTVRPIDRMETSSSSSSGLPPTFLAHMAKRKADEQPSSVSPLAPTAAPATRPAAPRIINPWSQKMHIDMLSDLSPSHSNFVVGPVFVENLAEGQKSARTGKKGPSTFEVVDRAGNRVVYKTFGSFSVLSKMFCSADTQCFYLAGGQVTETKKEYVRRGCQPCEVMVDTELGRSDTNLLMVRVAPDEWFIYMRGSSSPSPSSGNADVAPITVCDAMDEAAPGAPGVKNATVVGVVAAIEHRTAKNGNKFWTVQLVDRRDAASPERLLKFNVFEDRALANGWLLERFGDGGSYDRLLSATGSSLVVLIRGLDIIAGAQYPYELSRSGSIEEVRNFAQDRLNLVQVAPHSSLSTSTLGSLLSGPTNVPCNVLAAAAHMTEERQGTARGTGRKYPYRSISVIDSSRDVDGRHPVHSFQIYPPHPVIDAIADRGEPREPAFASLQGKQREFEITDPSRVLVVRLMGVYMEPAQEEGRRGYIGTKNMRVVIVEPTDGDAEAEALRTWYTQKGHLSFVPCARLSREFMDDGEIGTSAASSSSSSSSSSSYSSGVPAVKYDQSALRAAGEGDW